MGHKQSVSQATGESYAKIGRQGITGVLRRIAVLTSAMARINARGAPSGNHEQLADALADDLERWLREEPIHARAVGTAEHMLKWARRKPAVAL
jgi:hypothetical protein